MAKPDLIIIGGGPGGYATALRAVDRGLKVQLVGGGDVGGTCLHRGCVPSKALLHAASVYAEYRRFHELAGAAPTWEVDPKLLGRLREEVVTRLHSGLLGLLAGRGVEVFEARGRLEDEGVVTLDDGTRLEGHNVVLATGSLPRSIPGLTVDGNHVITSDHAIAPERVPSTALIVGGGAVGVEFATFWRSLGCSVTLVEMLDRLLPLEDPDSSKFLQRSFKRQGIDVRLGVAVAGGSVVGDHFAAQLSDGTAVQVDQVLVATGRSPNTSSVGAAELSLLDDRGYVVVDERCHTALGSTWAVGDVLPTVALAHVAFAEGFLVADSIAGIEVPPIRYDLIPKVTYCTPEVSSVGLTEEQARASFGEVKVTVTGLEGNARTLIGGESGQVKLVACLDGEIVGVHIVGPSATELIAEGALITTWGATLEEAADIVHPHPTVSEGMREAFLAGAGLPFHVHGRTPQRASTGSRADSR